MLAKFLTGPWRAYLEAAIGGALLIVVSLLAIQNGHLHAKVAKRDVRIAELSAANASMKAAVETQNAAVQAWQTEAAQREQKAQQAVNKARQQAAPYQARATQLLGKKASGDECQATKALLQDYYEGRL